MPPPAPEEKAARDRWEAAVRRQRPGAAAFQGPMVCPECGRPEVYPAQDLEHQTASVGERIVIANLTGARCRDCGAQLLDAASKRRVEEVLAGRMLARYRVQVSRLSRDRLGLYFPPDVVDAVGTRHGDRAELVPLARRRLLVLFSRADGENEAGARA